tara:strand:- start:14545 stop:17016 length:2472 start_codon:yes stop_codon:yes gene_type:complete
MKYYEYKAGEILNIRNENKDKFLLLETHIGNKDWKAIYSFDTLVEGENWIIKSKNYNLWWLLDGNKKMNFHIDFDYRLKDKGDWEIADKIYQNIINLMGTSVVAIANREDGDGGKYSKRIYTDMIFKNAECAKQYAETFCLDNNIDMTTLDTSIYNHNKLYPVVEYNVKDMRLMKWETKTHSNSCPNNVFQDDTVIEVVMPSALGTCPPAVKRSANTCRVPKGKRLKDNKDIVNKYVKQNKDINNGLFLDLLEAIPIEVWGYREWRNLGTFCKTYFNLNLFLAISRQNSKYTSDEECEKLWNGIDCNINAGYIVNLAKRNVDESIIKSIYMKNKFEGEFLTERFIAKQGHYYFGDYFLLIKQKKKYVPFCFSKNENKWRESSIKDFNNYVENYLDKGLKDHFVLDDGKIDRKLLNRYNTIVSGKIKLTYEFFQMNCEEVNYTTFDNNTNLCFSNGYYDFDKMSFCYEKDKNNLNLKTTRYDFCERVFPSGLGTGSTKKDFIQNYFDKIFPNKEDFEVFKYMISHAVMGNHQKYILFIKGRGNNGKSSFIPLILEAIGDYAGYADIECLTEPIGTIKPRIDLFNLIKRKVSVIQEPSVSKKINASSLKQITGGDQISFRSLYADETTDFVNNGLIVMSCNEMPDIDNPDTAVFNRLVVIEARSMFVNQQKYDEIAEDMRENVFIANPYFLTEEFRKEYKGTMFEMILEWIREYKDKPFELTQNIMEENKRYIGDNDTAEYFMDNYTMTNNEEDFIKIGDLYRDTKRDLNIGIGRNKFIKFFRNHPQYGRFFIERYKDKKENNKEHRNVLWGYKRQSNDNDDEED